MRICKRIGLCIVLILIILSLCLSVSPAIKANRAVREQYASEWGIPVKNAELFTLTDETKSVLSVIDNASRLSAEETFRFVLTADVVYYARPNSLGKAQKLSAGTEVWLAPYLGAGLGYGLAAIPTEKAGWSCVLPFAEVSSGDWEKDAENAGTQFMYVKTEALLKTARDFFVQTASDSELNAFLAVDTYTVCAMWGILSDEVYDVVVQPELFVNAARTAGVNAFRTSDGVSHTSPEGYAFMAVHYADGLAELRDLGITPMHICPVVTTLTVLLSASALIILAFLLLDFREKWTDESKR